MNPSNITFLIPGYLPPGKLVAAGTEQVSSTPLPAMQWQTGLVQQPWQANFERTMGFVESTGLQLPMARLMCADQPETVGLVCADPVYLQADRDTAKLLPVEMLALNEAELQNLIEDINAFLLTDNMALKRGPEHGWYLSGMDASLLASFPPSFLANRNASAYLPEGEDSGDWRRLMTEIQMLLHAHPVNQQREQQGKLPINCLWFWGGAPKYSSSSELKATYTGCVYADDEFTRAACANLQVACRPLTEFDPLLSEDSLVIDTRIASAIFNQDEPQMIQVIEQIDHQWLAPLGNRVKEGRVQQLVIFNEDGDKGVLTKELLTAHLREEHLFTRALNAIRLPEKIKRWFAGDKQV